MPSRKKSNLSRNSRNALRNRLRKAQETDEERSERQAYNRRYIKKVKTENPPLGLRIENVRTLRPCADRPCSEKDWLKAVKRRMYSEKQWLAAMKERLNSKLELQGRLDCDKDVHCMPLLNSEMEPLNCENPSISEKDPSNSEKDSYMSEQDSYTSVEGGLDFPCLREKTQTAVTIKLELLDD